jgi:hypothetical protein
MDQVNNKGNIIIALLGHSFGGIVCKFDVA